MSPRARVRACYPLLVSSIGDVVRDLVGGARRLSLREHLIRLAPWPPDVFATTSVLLRRSGAYRFAVSSPVRGWPVTRRGDSWARGIERAAATWRRAVDRHQLDTKRRFVAPARVAAAIAALTAVEDVELALLGSAKALADARLSRATLAMLFLHGCADTACAGWGIPHSFPELGSVTDLGAVLSELTAEGLLGQSGSMSRLEADRVRVLPKTRTPRAGISIRSLSHHLAVYQGETRIAWSARQFRDDAQEQERRLNLMLFPWPDVIHPRAFRPGRQDGWATVEIVFPEAPHAVADRVRRALDVARNRGLVTHGVVFPEAALTESEFDAVVAALGPEDPWMVLAGVRGHRSNAAWLRLRADQERWFDPHKQPKHHRWCVDGEQIHNYHLGSVLHPDHSYWEDIEIHERSLEFTSCGAWLTMCHLVCEDLARLDPVSEVIRAVGPNLVVALLMDGPQLENRWPGRYASVLADDPGSSVLSFTSIGMVARSVPRGTQPSRVVALWKDCKRGAREICLDRDAVAIHLSLCATFDEEQTADRRSDGGTAGVLVFAGMEQVRPT